MKTKQNVLNIVFLLSLAAFLLAGLGKALFAPKAINLYENRKAYQWQRPTLSAYLEASFQDSVEKALSDQVLFSQTMKQLYNQNSTGLLLEALSGFLQANPDRYIKLLGMETFGGTLVYGTRTLADMVPALDEKLQGLNALIGAHPELGFYVYYIEKDTDINFETGEKVGAYEYLRERLELPQGRMARFQVDSFADFSRWFYRTDHHWNGEGSYRGYTQVASLLGVEESLLEPAEELTLPYAFSGSKASTAGAKDVFQERFTAYRFAYPAMEISVNGAPAGDYGSQEAYWDGSPASISYGDFYGGDFGETVFDTGTQGRGNLLVLGESYDNAILKLLAAHFDKTFSIDLRYYQGEEDAFSFSDYCRENQVDTVLLIGNIDYFTVAEFLPED